MTKPDAEDRLTACTGVSVTIASRLHPAEALNGKGHLSIQTSGYTEVNLDEALAHLRNLVKTFDRWARPGWSVLVSLPGDRFLVNTSDGSPLVINGDGCISHRWQAGGMEWGRRHGNVLLLADKQQVWAADLELRPLWQASWPGNQVLPSTASSAVRSTGSRATACGVGRRARNPTPSANSRQT